jgi:ribosomal protein S18 acetylase RimI-like enzyme
MASNHQLEMTAGFTTEGKPAFQALLATCNAAENIDLPFFFGVASTDSQTLTHVFVHRNGVLIGFGHIWAGTEPEACLMVDPAHRRSGIGGAILEAFKAELRRRGLAGCLLVADQASVSARDFLAAKAIPYRSTEYRLELDHSRIDRSRPRIDGFAIRPAGRADASVLTDLLSESFDEDPAEAKSTVERAWNETTRRFYVASLYGRPVGVIRAGEVDGAGDLTAFGVLPPFRGKGIGRQFLNDAVDLLISQGLDRVLIEVDTDNANALGLYESCGFRVTSEYGFYWLDCA